MWAFIIVCLLGFLVLFIGAFHQKSLVLPMVFAGLAAALVANYFEWESPLASFIHMVDFGHYSLAFSSLLIVLTILLFAFSAYHFRNEDHHIADIYGVCLFSLAGGLAMVAHNHMVMLFLGIEILSIALYVLAGSRRMMLASNEAALKYFLMGAFASGFLLLGIALIFGETNSFNLNEISAYVANIDRGTPLLHSGLLLILVGLCFKIGAVPFHTWAPDVYQGAPIFVTAFMATVVKTSAVAAFFKLFQTCFSGVDYIWFNILWIIAAATILIGNLVAAKQLSAKRLYAFSGVANAGYLLMPLLALNELSASSILYYAMVYSLATLAIFAIIMVLAGVENDIEIDKFRGLVQNNKLLAGVMVLATLSLAGIPPLGGFFGKFMLFDTALKSNLLNLVIVAVVGSLIGVYYYFRPMVALFDRSKGAPDAWFLPKGFRYTLLLVALLLVLAGLFPGWITDIL